MRATFVSAALFAGQALAFALPNPIENLIGETLELVHLEHLDKRVCPHDNLLRCLIGTPSLAVPFCSSSANVIATTPTVFVTSTPTASVTSTSTTLQTVTSTTSVTATQTTSTTITVAPPAQTITVTYVKKRTITVSDGGGGGGGGLGGSSCTPPVIYSKRAAPATSLACLTNLNPSAAAVTSACSCFSGSYTPAAVTETLIAPTVTVTPFVTGVTQSVTAGVTVTVDTMVTVTVTSTSTVSICSVSLP